MFDLSTEQGRNGMAAKIVADIDAASVQLYSEGRRNHLGGSEIGEPCSRALYYKFRWCWQEVFAGRMLRLFNQGHREEERFVTYLTAIGWTVWEKDPETGKQWRMSSAHGHHGGSNDMRGLPPKEWGFEETFLGEFKTVSEKNFTGLKKARSVAAFFPKYYAQMCEYGFKAGLRFAVFLANNKNTNEIYCEIVSLNHAFGQSLEVKANEIVFAKQPPPRISENPADYKCAYCFAKKGCFFNEPVDKNCRSCRHSEPVEDAQWRCNRFEQIIPAEYIPQGCGHHLSVNE